MVQFEAAHLDVKKFQARIAEPNQNLSDRALVNPGHATDGPNRHAFD